MSTPNEQKAGGLWLAFSAGMYSDALTNAGRLAGDETIDRDDTEAMFRVVSGFILDELGVDAEQAARTFELGRVFMRDMRASASTVVEPAKPEDCPPLAPSPSVPPPQAPIYTGPERQLTGKADRRLS